jgi:hypothetical protein
MPHLRATERARRNATRHFPSSKKLFLRYRKSAVPEGGWTQENFTGEAKEELRHDMLMARRAALSRGLRNVAPALANLMRGQIERVIQTALESFARLYGIPIKSWRGYTKEDFDFTVPNEAGMWASAIEQELARTGVEVVAMVTPSIQSVASDIFEKVNIMLGVDPTQAQIQALGVRVREIATLVTNVNDTTRTRLVDTIARAIREDKTVFETAEIIRRRIPQIATNRVPTIVRTELGNAADAAVKHSMRESGVVTHFDVIGCEAVELNSPKYKGMPTCNIKGVPIRDERLVKFHPNHTGAIVAGAFFKENGDEPIIPLREGTGDGTPEGG